MDIAFKRALVTAAVLGLVASHTWAATQAPSAQVPSSQQQNQPVVIELFQSQGCSSCPPAQDYLNKLAQQPDVLALSFAVTYWDDLGWKDTFGSPQFTERQREYSANNGKSVIATPQFWVNGRETVLGANPFRVAQLIEKGGPRGVPALAVKGNTLSVGTGSAPAGGADIWLVHYEPRNLQVAISAGENKGRTLPHRDIVRQLQRIGVWKGAATAVALPAAAADTLQSAVLVQGVRGGPILSAIKVPADSR